MQGPGPGQKPGMQGPGPGQKPGPGAPVDKQVIERAQRAEARAAQLEAELKRLQAEAAAAVAGAAGGGDGHTAELKQRAREVYDGINEALSELRTTILTAQGLFGEVSSNIGNDETSQAIADAINGSMDRTEDAKGLLRSLKELAE
jgi:hypothetical protein